MLNSECRILKKTVQIHIQTLCLVLYLFVLHIADTSKWILSFDYTWHQGKRWYVLISPISEYQISNVQCFEYPISNQLHGECQIANVQYKKTVQILRFGFLSFCVT